QRAAERDEAHIVRVFVQSASAVQSKHDALCARVPAGMRVVAWMESDAEAFGILFTLARACHSHVWSRFADVFAGASPGHQPLFIRDFHRLGRGHCLADTR